MISAAPMVAHGTALLMIDAQEEYFTPGGPLELPSGADALAAAAGLLGWARRSGAHVIHVRHVSDHPAATEFRRDSPASAIRSEVAPVDGEPVVEKTTPSAFAGTRLQEILTERGIATVVVAGFMTTTCCTATAHEAIARRYRTVFASDATAALPNGAASHQRVQEHALGVQRQIGAEVLSADSIARLMTATAA